MLWFLLVALFVLAAALVPAWLRTRATLRDYYLRPLTYLPLTDAPVPPGAPGDAAHAELSDLGYESRFWMAPEAGPVFFRVYTHRELPIFALVAHAHDASGVYAAVPQLESFLPAGGRLSTTPSRDFGRLVGEVAIGAPRLIQWRSEGPATAAALDGQHAGTVRAWLSGGREFLPADPDRFLDYLQQDHHVLGEALSATGWLTLPRFLRALAGRPRGVLRF